MKEKEKLLFWDSADDVVIKVFVVGRNNGAHSLQTTTCHEGSRLIQFDCFLSLIGFSLMADLVSALLFWLS